MKKKYILILGTGRSGTTAIAKRLSNCSEKICYLPELKYFYIGLSNRIFENDITKIYTRSIEKFLKFNPSFKEKINIETSTEKFREYIKKNNNKNKRNKYENYKIVLDFLIKEIVEDRKCEFFILQTPNNIIVLDLIVKVLDLQNLFIIYTIRDARSFVVSAYKGRLKWANDFIKTIAYWNYTNKVLYRKMKKYKGILVKQEDFLLNEKFILKKLEEFLNLKFNCKNDSTKIINSSFDDSKNKRTIVNRWNDILNENEKKIIETLSCKLLNKCNYEVTFPCSHKRNLGFTIITKYIFYYLKYCLSNMCYKYGIKNICSIISRFIV